MVATRCQRAQERVQVARVRRIRRRVPAGGLAIANHQPVVDLIVFIKIDANLHIQQLLHGRAAVGTISEFWQITRDRRVELEVAVRDDDPGQQRGY